MAILFFSPLLKGSERLGTAAGKKYGGGAEARF